MRNDILDLHSHTTASGHAYNTLYEMVQAAADKHIFLFGCSDHGPRIPGACHPFNFINFKVIPRKLFGVHLLMGCELNLIDYQGNVDLDPVYLNQLDYALAGIHDPCYSCGTVSQNTSAYVGAIQNPAICIISHPDDSRFPFDYDTVTAAAKEHHKLLEVNNSSLHPLSPRKNSRENYLTMLKYCRKYQTSIIINSDAHIAADVGNHEFAWELLHEIDFPEELIVNTSMDRIIPYIPALKNNKYLYNNPLSS